MASVLAARRELRTQRDRPLAGRQLLTGGARLRTPTCLAPGQTTERGRCEGGKVERAAGTDRVLELSKTCRYVALRRCCASGELARGAGNRVRTGDIQLGKLTLYQLSYARMLTMTKAAGW